MTKHISFKIGLALSYAMLSLGFYILVEVILNA